MRIFELFEVEKTQKALFLAGPPGSGKSYIANQVAAGTGAKIISIDDLVELVAKKRNIDLSSAPEDEIQKLYKEVFTKHQKRQMLLLQSKASLVIDGTGRKVERVLSMKNDLEQMGYITGMLYVTADLETVMARNSRRERSLDPKFIEQTWHETISNLRKLHSLFDDDKFFFVRNEEGRDNSEVFRKARNFLMS